MQTNTQQKLSQTIIKYLIRDNDREEMYWGGDCLFGKLDIKTRNWEIPKTNSNFNIYPTSDSIIWSPPPVIPFVFDSYSQAESAIKYIPRKFNVSIVSLHINFSIANE